MRRRFVFLSVASISSLSASDPPACGPTSPYRFEVQGSTDAGVNWTGAPGCDDVQPFTRFVRSMPHLSRVQIAGNTLSIEAIDESCNVVDGSRTTIHKGEKSRRGDANQDGVVDIADPITTLFHLFVALVEQAQCRDATDFTHDGDLLIGDAIGSLQFLFVNGKAPPAPGPTS
jgi:hypothetical protein